MYTRRGASRGEGGPRGYRAHMAASCTSYITEEAFLCCAAAAAAAVAATADASAAVAAAAAGAVAVVAVAAACL